MSGEKSYLEFNIGNDRLKCRHVRSSRRKRLSLEIDAGGEITLRSPEWLPMERVMVFLTEHRHWILEKLAQTRQGSRPASDSGVSPEENNPRPFLGRNLELLIEAPPDCARLICRREGSRLLILGRGQVSVNEPALDNSWKRQWEERLSQAIVKWYRKEAHDHFLDRLNHFASLMGVKFSRMAVGDQRGRWGSCSSQGVIRLNWRLLMAPEAILDYVVVHELAHIPVHNHSAAFWRVVETFLPDYRQRRRELKELGPSLMKAFRVSAERGDC